MNMTMTMNVMNVMIVILFINKLNNKFMTKLISLLIIYNIFKDK
jgi:hypothetical protein